MHVLTPFLLMLPTAFATTTIHYYKNPSCNAGTDNGNYDAPLNKTADDTQCHAIANPTKALYINGLDDGCGVIAYQSIDCAPDSAAMKVGIKGDCFYLANTAQIQSWRSVCGSALSAASASLSAAMPASTSAANATSASASASASATGVRSGADGRGLGGGVGGLVIAVVLGVGLQVGGLI